MAGGTDALTRLWDNVYSRLFEQSPLNQNLLLTNVQVATDTSGASNDDNSGPSGSGGLGILQVTSRAYAALTVTGANGAQGDGSYRITAGTRVQYGSGIISLTKGAAALRFEANFAYNTGTDHYLFAVYGTGGSQGLFCFYRASDDKFVLRRVGATTTGEITVSGGTFASATKFTLSVAWDMGRLYARLNANIFTFADHADVPTVKTASMDFGSNAGAEHADCDFYWILVADEQGDAYAVTTEANIVRLAAFGQTFAGHLDALVAEATTNYGTDPDGVTPAQWVIDDAVHCALSAVTGQVAPFGITTAILATISGALTNQIAIKYAGPTGIAGDPWAYRIAIKTGGTAVGKTLDVLVRQIGGAHANTFLYLTNITATAAYQEIDLVGATQDFSDRTQMEFRVTYPNADSANGDLIYVTCQQIEKKLYLTPRCTGSLGAGFAWTGTPNASSSTRAAGSVAISSAAMSEIAGAIIWCGTPHVAMASLPDASETCEWSDAGYANANAMRIIKTGTTWYAEGYRNSVQTLKSLGADSFAVDVKRMTLVGWDAGLLYGAVDAVASGAIQSATRNGTVGGTALAATASFGGRGNQTLQLDAGTAWGAAMSRMPTQTEWDAMRALIAPPSLAQLIAITGGTATIYLWDGSDTFYWTADHRDAIAASLYALGDTDPNWEDYRQPAPSDATNIDLSFLWEGVDSSHEAMSNRVGETDANAA